MCRRVDCSQCGRPTYAGCGAHVEQVLRDVPLVDRCRGHDEKLKDAKPAASAARRSWLDVLLGK